MLGETEIQLPITGVKCLIQTIRPFAYWQMEHILSFIFIITKQDLHYISGITKYLLVLGVFLAILLQSFFVPWSPLFWFVFLSFTCLCFEKKVIQKSCEDVYIHMLDFVSLFQFVCLSTLPCMSDWQHVPWHYNCSLLCPSFGICGQPPQIVFCLPLGQKNSRSDVCVRRSLIFQFLHIAAYPLGDIVKEKPLELCDHPCMNLLT